MQTAIYCVRTANGKHAFYMTAGRKEYYLFSQDYRRGVQNYFGRSVYLKDALNYAKSNRDSAVIRTMDKLPLYIRYIEREYGIAVLERTRFCGRSDPYRAAKRERTASALAHAS